MRVGLGTWAAGVLCAPDALSQQLGLRAQRKVVHASSPASYASVALTPFACSTAQAPLAPDPWPLPGITGCWTAWPPARCACWPAL